LEKNRRIEAGLGKKKYKEILDEEYRFSVWAIPKNEKGEIDYNKRKINHPNKENMVFLSKKERHRKVYWID